MKQGFANGKKHGIVVLAEGVMDADKFKDELLKYGDFDARANVLGHMQRGGSPTMRDRVLASEMGAYAVILLYVKTILAVYPYLCLSLETGGIRKYFIPRHPGGN